MAWYLGHIKAVQGPGLKIEAKSLPSMDWIEIKFNPAGIGYAHTQTHIHTSTHTNTNQWDIGDWGQRSSRGVVRMVTPLVDYFLWMSLWMSLWPISASGLSLPVQGFSGQPEVKNHMPEGHMILTGGSVKLPLGLEGDWIWEVLEWFFCPKNSIFRSYLLWNESGHHQATNDQTCKGPMLV